MQFDPLVPLPLIVVGGVVLVALMVARVRRAGFGAAILRWFLMALLAAAIAADPTTTGGTSEARRTAADVIFVVDSTSSMAAVDYDGTAPRLDGVRSDIREIAAAFPGANFALIRFDSQARIELPWTTDLAALDTAVSVIRQERAVYSRGSALDMALPVVDQMLPRHGSGGSDEDDDSYSIVFYFSDGEERRLPTGELPQVDTATSIILGLDDGTDEPVTFADVAADIDDGAVLGYGTASGAPMIEFHGSDEIFTSTATPYVIDYATGGPAISRLDADRLRRIAGELGLPFLHRTEPGGLGDLASSLADAAPVVNDGSRETLHRLYWIAAIPLVALIMWQGVLTIAEASSARTLLGVVRRSEPAVAPVPDAGAATGRQPERGTAA